MQWNVEVVANAISILRPYGLIWRVGEAWTSGFSFELYSLQNLHDVDTCQFVHSVIWSLTYKYLLQIGTHLGTSGNIKTEKQKDYNLPKYFAHC